MKTVVELQGAWQYVSDVDVGDTLPYSATLADGTACQVGLSFYAEARTFSARQAMMMWVVYRCG